MSNTEMVANEIIDICNITIIDLRLEFTSRVRTNSTDKKEDANRLNSLTNKILDIKRKALEIKNAFGGQSTAQ